MKFHPKYLLSSRIVTASHRFCSICSTMHVAIPQMEVASVFTRIAKKKRSILRFTILVQASIPPTCLISLSVSIAQTAPVQQQQVVVGLVSPSFRLSSLPMEERSGPKASRARERPSLLRYH